MAACLPIRRIWRCLGSGPVFALCLLTAFCLPRGAAAQHHGSMTGGHGGFGNTGGFGTSGGGMRPDIHEQLPDRSGDRSSINTMHGLRLGPPGRWWDDKHFAKKLQLRPDQKQHMDAIFEQNRTVLLQRYEALQQEEQRMEALTHTSNLNENALFSQIDRVEQARADLEKANTHLLFQLRNEMNADQLTTLASKQ